MLGQPHHLAGQQLQRPAGAARGRLCAGGRHQQRFLRAGELAGGAGTRLLAERPLQVALHEAALGPIDGRAADRDASGDVSSGTPASAASKDLGALERAGRVLAAAEHRLEFARSASLSSTR